MILAARCGGRLDQVPPVPVEILEDRDGAIILAAGRLDEPNATLGVGEVVTREVVRLKEQEHAAAALVADCRSLSLPTARASSSPPAAPGGATTTHRFPSSKAVSSRRVKPRLPTKNKMASS
jgi:hypothetical protein